MRVWDIPVEDLCNKHLVAQHYEIHCIYSIITKDLKGYRNHPEIKRWEGYIGSLARVHDLTAEEMAKRCFNHKSDLPEYTFEEYPESYQSIEVQIEVLRNKGCQCKVVSMLRHKE